MAVSQLQLNGFGNVNNLVDQAQWNTLANLRNVYQQQQDRQTKLAALGSLGTDQQANMQTLLKSGDPALAQVGLNIQQKLIDEGREDKRYSVTDARANAELALRQAENARAQGNYDKADENERQAAEILKRLPQPGQTGAPSPDVFTRGAPPIAPVAPGSPTAPMAAPPMASSLPVAPLATLAPQPPPQAPQAPPGVTTGMAPSPPPEPVTTGIAPPQVRPAAPPIAPPQAAPIQPSAIAPSQLQATGAMTARIANNLTSGQPAAMAGISRDDLAEMYRNPITRPLATAMLQKMYDPGSWTYHDMGNGKIVGTNTRGETKVVYDQPKPITMKEGEQLLVPDANAPTGYRDATPGGAPAGKEQRDRDARYADAIRRQYPEGVAREYALTGKLPGEDLKPGQQKRVDTLTDNSRVSGRVLDQVNQLRTISKDAWGFRGAGPASLAAATVLPNALATSSGAVATQDLINAAHSNVANVAKSVFGSRVSNLDVNLLKDLESSASQPDVVRQKIYDRAQKVFTKIQQEDDAEAEGIRNKTWYRPGGGARGAPSGNAPVDFRDYFGKK